MRPAPDRFESLSRVWPPMVMVKPDVIVPLVKYSAPDAPARPSPLTATFGFTVMDKVLVPMAPTESVALTVMLYVPAAVRLETETTPVIELIVIPETVGVIEKVLLPVPPDAEKAGVVSARV